MLHDTWRGVTWPSLCKRSRPSSSVLSSSIQHSCDRIAKVQLLVQAMLLVSQTAYLMQAPGVVFVRAQGAEQAGDCTTIACKTTNSRSQGFLRRFCEQSTRIIRANYF